MGYAAPPPSSHSEKNLSLVTKVWAGTLMKGEKVEWARSQMPGICSLLALVLPHVRGQVWLLRKETRNARTCQTYQWLQENFLALLAPLVVVTLFWVGLVDLWETTCLKPIQFAAFFGVDAP